ncbi:MAG: isoprenylcysteine carboxylmethyltransferase family protein [Asgard group archaeon]|nr:isoprenylcysteine carboxylmethyltransferase family protein [Asgard group archaeon]
MNLKTKALLITILLSIIFILVLPVTWTDLQEYQLWKNIDIIFLSKYPFLTLFKTIHLIFGGLFFALGCYYSIIIISINRDAHSSRNNPSILLTEGFYGKVRHPMYSMFTLIFIGLSFALCSSLAIAVSGFTILVLITLIFIEEKQILVPSFGEEYQNYKKKVPRYFLQNWQWILIILLLAFNIIGIFF